MTNHFLIQNIKFECECYLYLILHLDKTTLNSFLSYFQTQPTH